MGNKDESTESCYKWLVIIPLKNVFKIQKVFILKITTLDRVLKTIIITSKELNYTQKPQIKVHIEAFSHLYSIWFKESIYIIKLS